MFAVRSFLAAALTAGLAFGAQAQTFVGASGASTIPAISPLLGFDLVSLQGLGGAWTGPGAQTVGNIQFAPAAFCLLGPCGQTASGTLTGTMTVGVTPMTLSMGWSLVMDGNNDTVTLFTPVAMDFVQPGGEVDHVVFSIATTTLTANAPTTTLDATVEVPEPAAWAAMLLGLVGLGAMRRREAVALPVRR